MAGTRQGSGAIGSMDMDSLKATIEAATEGTGQVSAAILKATGLREQAFTALITLCGKAKQWAKALEVFECMKTSFPSLRPNTFVYTAVISALAAANKWELALEHFEKMKALSKADPDVRPNQYTFSAVISACGRGGKLDTALALYEEMRGTPGLQPDGITYSTLISVFEKSGRWDVIEEVVEQMHHAGYFAAHGTYSALLEQYRRQGAWGKGLGLFLAMQETGAGVNSYSCLLLMRLLAAGKRAHMALFLLNEMQRAQMQVSLQHWEAAQEAVSGAGLPKLAAQLQRRAKAAMTAGGQQQQHANGSGSGRGVGAGGQQSRGAGERQQQQQQRQSSR